MSLPLPPAIPPKPLPHSLTKAAFAGWRLVGAFDPWPVDATSMRLEWANDSPTGTFDWSTIFTLQTPATGTAAPYSMPWSYNQKPPGIQWNGVIRWRWVAINAGGETPGPAALWAYSRPFFDPTDPGGQRGIVMRFLDVANTLGHGVGASSLLVTLQAEQGAPALTDVMVRAQGQLTEMLPLDANGMPDATPLLHQLALSGTAERELRLRRVSLVTRDGIEGYGSLFCFSDAIMARPPSVDPLLATGVATALAAQDVGASEGAPGWELTDGQGYTAHVREGTSAPDGWAVALSRAASGHAVFTITPPNDRLSFDALSIRRLDTGEAARFRVPEGNVPNAGGWSQIRRFLVTPGGEPDTEPPAPPGELEMVLQGHTFLDLRHKAMPLRGRSLRVQRLGNAGWETLLPVSTVGGALAQLSDLVPDTLYLLRSLAVNTVGQTPGPEQHVRTLAHAPTGPLNAPGAPTLAARTPSSATIAQSAWQPQQTAMRLYRNGRLVHTFTAAGQTFVDILARHGDEYTLVAVARAGFSEHSAPLLLNLRSNATITIHAPLENATLAGNFEVLFSANVVLSLPSVTIGGLSRGAFLREGKYYVVGHTSVFTSGPRIITARGLDPDGFPVEASIAVVLVNDASSSTKYLSFKDTAETAGMNLGRVNVGARTGKLSPSVFRRFWMQARLLSSGKPGIAENWGVGSLSQLQLAVLFDAAQPVTLVTGGGTPVVGNNADGVGGVGGSRWHYKSHQAVDKPGKTVYLLLRQTPVQTLFWLDTERDVVVSIKDIARGAPANGLGVLARNIEPSAPGAALWRFTVTPIDTGEPNTGPLYSVPLWEKLFDLDEHAPDAFDWASMGTKLYVLRDNASAVRVLDRDPGEEVLDITLPSVGLPPRFLERMGTTDATAKVLVLSGTSSRTVCFDLSFPAPKIAWDVAYGISACTEFGGDLLIARGNRVYHSALGVGAPTLLAGSTASDIVTLSRDVVVVPTADGGTAGGSVQATYARTVDGAYHLVTKAGGVVVQPALTIDDGGASGVGTWAGALDTVHGLAVANPITAGPDAGPARIVEQGADGAWYPGVRLEPPGDATAPTVATAVKGFAYELRAASGSVISPGYKPPLLDWKMLVGTGTGGMVAVLEQARLGANDGAVLAGPVEHAYVQGLDSPVPVVTSDEEEDGGGAPGGGSSPGGA